jgi:hypothetical protein
MLERDSIAQDTPGSGGLGALGWRLDDRSSRAGSAPLWLAALLAVLLLIGAGVAYRVAGSGLPRIEDNPVALPVPLRDIPMQINGWTGRDMSLPTTTEEYIRANFADDYVSRQYTKETEGLSAEIYVVYCCSYPSGLSGHKPSVCFPAHGWVPDLTRATEITTRSGRKIPCLMHQFHKPSPDYEQVSVLSFYVVNGEITLRERDFSGFFDRLPNISGNRARFVAQVQVNAEFDRAAELAAADLVDTILTFLPDRTVVSGTTGPATSPNSNDGR